MAVVWATLFTTAAFSADAARVLYFEPLRTTSLPNGAARKSLTSTHELQFDAYGRRFALTLETNDKLSGALQAKADSSSLQLYRGKVDGVSDSWVRLALAGGELQGMIWDGAELYVVAPMAQVADSAPSAKSDTSTTAIFRLADVLMEPGAASCATDTSSAARTGAQAYGSLVQELKNTAALMQAAGAQRRLQVSALGDALFRSRHASEQAARDQILIRLNNVDGIFSAQLGIEIQVPSVAIDSSLSDTTTPLTLLEELSVLRRNSPGLHASGLTHLFTGRDLDGTTVGIAYLGKLCNRQYGAGLTESINRGSWAESLIAAHEIGHNFGAVHDGDPNEACAATPTDTFLMSANTSGSNQFSQCSLSLMQPNAQSATCITALQPADVVVASDLGTVRQPVGRTFDWNLSVGNSGGSAAVGVNAEVLVPPSVAVLDAYVVGGSCTSGGGVVNCQLGDISASASRLVQLTLRGDVIGSSSITARVSAANETASANNQGEGVLLIASEADLALALQAPASATTGQPFDLSFSVTSLAAIEATNLRIDIELPDGVTAASATLAGGSCTVQSAGLQCTLPTLPAGATASGSATISAATVGSSLLRGRISGSYFDPTPGNDSAEITVTVSGAAALSASSGSSGGGGAFGWFLLSALLALRLVPGRRLR